MTAARFVLISASLLLFAACSEDSPFVPNVTSIEISPRDNELGLGVVVEYAIEAVTEEGDTVTDTRLVDWLSSDPTVATVTDRGVATGIGLGETWIVATSEMARDSVRLAIAVCPGGPNRKTTIPPWSYNGETWQTGPVDSIIHALTHIEGSVIIRFKETDAETGVDPVDLRRLVSDATIERMQGEVQAFGINICRLSERFGQVTAEIPPPLLLPETIAWLRSHLNIDFVEPNALFFPAGSRTVARRLLQASSPRSR